MHIDNSAKPIRDIEITSALYTVTVQVCTRHTSKSRSRHKSSVKQETDADYGTDCIVAAS